MSWHPIVRQPGEGEQILFKIGLMTFKAASSETDGQFMVCETVLPPGAAVEPHQHPEAEWFYVLDGEFAFWVGDDDTPVTCGPGAFVSAPPHVRHAYANRGAAAGRILGMLAPAAAGGLESFFRQMGVPVRSTADIPDLDRPVAHLQAVIAHRRG